MFVLTNAWRTVLRHKWRSLAILVVAMLVMFGSVFATAVHAEDHKAHTTTYSLQRTTAVIRPTAKEFVRESNADSSITKDYVSLDTYNNYLQMLEQGGMQPQYSMSVAMPMRQTGTVKAIAGKADKSADETGGEYTMYGLYNSAAETVNIPGQFKMTQGKSLNYKSKDGKAALVSEAFAQKNHLKVGSSFSIANPNDATKVYKFKVRGIYTYTDPAPVGMGADAKLAKNNRDNAIYVGPYAFNNNNLNDDSATGWGAPRFDVGFEFGSPDEYTAFASAAKTMKLPKGYEMSTPDLDHYKASLKPLDNLDATMKRVLVGIYAGGGVIALALVALSMCRRRDEIAMDMVIGVVRGRIGWQFALETLIPTLPGLLVGGVAAAFASKPLGAALASGHATKVTSACWMPMWYCLGFVALLAIIAFMRAIVARTESVFDTRESAAMVSAVDDDADANKDDPDIDTSAGKTDDDSTDDAASDEEAEA